MKFGSTTVKARLKSPWKHHNTALTNCFLNGHANFLWIQPKIWVPFFYQKIGTQIFVNIEWKLKIKQNIWCSHAHFFLAQRSHAKLWPPSEPLFSLVQAILPPRSHACLCGKLGTVCIHSMLPWIQHGIVRRPVVHKRTCYLLPQANASHVTGCASMSPAQAWSSQGWVCALVQPDPKG